MEITFLGTSSGVPTRRRNVSGLALRGPRERSWYLVDCGEGTQHRLLQTRYSLHRLRAIFITHVHGDHCLGLPGLLASAGMAGRTEPLTIIAPTPLRTLIETVLDVTQSYVPYPWHFLPVETLQSWPGPDLRVDKWPLSHRVPSYAYRFTETDVKRSLDKDKLETAGIPRGPVWGDLLAGKAEDLPEDLRRRRDEFLLPPRKARRVIVAGDNDRPDLLATACEQTDLLIHESTYTQDVFERVGAERQHSHAGAVAHFAADVGLPNLILTHFSPRYQQPSRGNARSLADLEEEARSQYRGNLHLAEDLARYHLNKEGILERL